MRHIILLSLIFVASISYAQDLIITTSSDSLRCKIVEVNANDIQFKFGQGRVIYINRNEVASFQYNFETVAKTEERREKVEKISYEDQTPISYHALIADGREVFQGGKALKKENVRKLMVGNDALRLYNKGISQNRNGNIMLISGLGLVAGGTFMLITQPIKKNYTGEDGNSYYKYEEGTSKIIGIALAGTGAVFSITGITLKISSKTSIKNSVKSYNNLKASSDVELKFDFTGTGANLAIRF